MSGILGTDVPARSLIADARAIAAELAHLCDDELFAFVVPYQDQAARAAALDHFGQTLSELRRAGWRLRVHTRRFPDGEVFGLEVTDSPPVPKEDH
jgi:hypothetical protein